MFKSPDARTSSASVYPLDENINETTPINAWSVRQESNEDAAAQRQPLLNDNVSQHNREVGSTPERVSSTSFCSDYLSPCLGVSAVIVLSVSCGGIAWLESERHNAGPLEKFLFTMGAAIIGLAAGAFLLKIKMDVNYVRQSIENHNATALRLLLESQLERRPRSSRRHSERSRRESRAAQTTSSQRAGARADENAASASHEPHTAINVITNPALAAIERQALASQSSAQGYGAIDYAPK